MLSRQGNPNPKLIKASEEMIFYKPATTNKLSSEQNSSKEGG